MGLFLGMPTLIELKDIYETIDLCQKLKLNFVELNMNLPEYCPESLNSNIITNLTRDTGILFTLHLPEEIDLCSFQPSIRYGNIQRCKEALRWASESGIHLVNLHINSGIYFTLPDKKEWIYERYMERFLLNLEDAFTQLVAEAKKSNVVICIENSGNFHLPFIHKAIEKLIALDEVKLTWDVGHDAKTGYKEKDLLLRYQAKIGHMHLHDFNGVSDHQALFTGNVDIKGLISFAHQLDIGVVVEVKTVQGLVDSINRLKDLMVSHGQI